ncbi:MULTISPECIES: type II secretion system inner membrane protein GspF [unclassified Erwinia]|uniref:type II secretion system inner membrane protein GspF n=1 Tax=unclassified Erwinia TaxID=2622719 RepID=UPI0006F23254|nr:MULTISPECIES: type II secretion system inner membrane protein GspF [unclassified Erwinia]KQN58125.1 type II secretion system protein GspF [Erwinia sp. Leaf53]PLV62581.1 type II secretion protein F [Erwinia sp. B116]
MRFHYRAVNAQGVRQRGEIDADSPRDARQQLRDKQLTPLVLKPTDSALSSRFSRQRKPFSGNELVLLVRQLATLTAARLPLPQALQALATQSEKPAQRALLNHLRQALLEGASLAEAVALYPRIFTPLYRAMIAAGEASGNLPRVLEQLADYCEKAHQLKSKLTQAMIYPLLLTTVAIGVVAILLTAVVPKVVEQFSHMQQALPLSTRLLMTLSDVTRAVGLPLLAGGLLLMLLLRLAVRHPLRRLRWHRLQLRLPLLGRIMLDLNMARYARTLSILTNSAVPLLESMQIAATVLNNDYIRQQLQEAGQRVREGSAFTQALEQTHLLSPMMRHMIASGEQSGELDSMLTRAAEMQDRAFIGQMTLAVSLFEPLLVVVMAGVVLFIVLAILQPILQLNNLVG